MEWKYYNESEPPEYGKYITYNLNGSLGLSRYTKIYQDSTTGKFYDCATARHDVCVGNAWVAGNATFKINPIKGVVLYCEIPPLPEDIDKNNAEIQKCNEQIRALQARIKTLKSGIN